MLQYLISLNNSTRPVYETPCECSMLVRVVFCVCMCERWRWLTDFFTALNHWSHGFQSVDRYDCKFANLGAFHHRRSCETEHTCTSVYIQHHTLRGVRTLLEIEFRCSISLLHVLRYKQVFGKNLSLYICDRVHMYTKKIRQGWIMNCQVWGVSWHLWIK